MYLAARHLLISHLVYINLPFELMTAITACCVPFGEVTSGGSHGWGGIGCLLCTFTSVIVSFDCLYVNVSYVSFMYVISHYVHAMFAKSNFMDRCIAFFLCKYFICVSDK